MRPVCTMPGTLAALAVALSLMSPAQAGEASPLAAVEADLRKAYPGVPVMASAELAELSKTQDAVVLFDARTDAEYGVSRIAGAQRVDPNVPAAQFQSAFGDQIKGKKVVVYCAVGGRSSELANRIGDVAKATGAEGVYSLEGGIFRWHNEKRPLVGPSGATDEVHPFSPNAAALIARPEGIAYRPGTSKSARAE